jgi:phospholipase C
MENHSYGQVLGTPATPYATALAARCGVATNYWAEARPSLPNYIAMTSGATQGIADDNAPASHPLDVPNIFQQVGDWRALMESMPTNCAQTSSGRYAVKHNPAAYYTNVRDACAQRNVPLTDPPDVSARFTFVMPDMCNSTHDCTIQTGDSWLARSMDAILDSPEYRSGTTAVFLTYDEGAGDQHIATLIVSPSTRPGTVDDKRYDHYTMLRTTQEMLGLPIVLGGAVSAPSMRLAFGL